MNVTQIPFAWFRILAPFVERVQIVHYVERLCSVKGVPIATNFEVSWDQTTKPIICHNKRRNQPNLAQELEHSLGISGQLLHHINRVLSAVR